MTRLLSATIGHFPPDEASMNFQLTRLPKDSSVFSGLLGGLAKTLKCPPLATRSGGVLLLYFFPTTSVIVYAVGSALVKRS
jgi:phage shock protein PspC (stress-responsive transcriptional regulator)